MLPNSQGSKDWLKAHWGELSALQRRIMSMRYGLDGEKVRAVDETADELMLTREELRSEEAQILRLMRRDRPNL